MANATVLPPSTIRVQVGGTNAATVRNISYGGAGASSVALKGLTDVDMAGAQDRDVVTYLAASDSFIIAPAENSKLIIDNGFF